MSISNKIDKIEVYILSLNLARKIYEMTRNILIIKDFALVNQIRSAVISIPANIAEGYGRRTKKDFAQFLSIALGSANEVIAYLDFISLEYSIDTTKLKDEYIILGKKIYSFRSYLITHNTHPISQII